jgi:hypothetical protein
MEQNIEITIHLTRLLYPVRSCVQSPDELFEVMSQCLLSAVDRDALSGWGAVVHIM